VSITVAGHAHVMAVPDVGTIGAGVECRRPSAREALAAASAALETLLGSIDAFKVDRADVRTSGLGLAPQWDHTTSRFTGFVASASVGVTLRQPSRMGELLDAMVDAVGDDIRVHLVGLRFEDDRELRRRARDAAFADAREKAEQFAVLAGRALGPVRSIDESGGQAYAVQTINRSSGPGPTPTPLGEQAVSVGLVVVFEFA